MQQEKTPCSRDDMWGRPLSQPVQRQGLPPHQTPVRIRCGYQRRGGPYEQVCNMWGCPLSQPVQRQGLPPHQTPVRIRCGYQRRGGSYEHGAKGRGSPQPHGRMVLTCCTAWSLMDSVSHEVKTKSKRPNRKKRPTHWVCSPRKETAVTK